MAYCTQSDIEKRIGVADLIRLADLDGDGAADAATVTQAIQDAQGDLDSYLQKVYTVPVAPVPAVLRKHTTNMAIYYLQLGRDSVTDDYKKAFDDAIAWVKDVAAGKAQLGAQPNPAASSGAPGVEYDGQPRIFGRDEYL